MSKYLGAAHTNPRDAYRDVPILKQPTWNHEVAAYFFFGGISAGSAMLGSIAGIAGGEKHKHLARLAHWVSFATLLPCPPLLIDDLGMPERFHHMLRVFKPASPMNLGSWALISHGAGATLLVMKMLSGEDQLLGKLPLVAGLLRVLPERLLAGLGLPSALLLAGYSGVLLGTTSVPVWYSSPLLGGLFTSSAFGTGVAATSLAATLTGRDTEEESAELAALVAAAGITETALLMGYVATTGEARTHLLKNLPGKLMASAAACLVASTLIELASLATGKHDKKASALSSTTALAGGALLRWAVVKAGKASAADREGTLRAMSPRRDSPGWRATHT
ncbi:MAG: NrfD/PsrC family molybdoenzyme membrane anchor subunit [Chloroflexia bacterium]